MTYPQVFFLSFGNTFFVQTFSCKNDHDITNPQIRIPPINMSPLAHFTFFQCSLFHRYATRHAAEADAPGHARLQPQLAAAHAAPAADAARWPPGPARPALRPARRPTDAAARPPAAAAHPCARALRSAAAAAGPVPARVHGRAQRPAAGQDDAPEQPRRHDAVRAGPRPAAVHERHAARAGRPAHVPAAASHDDDAGAGSQSGSAPAQGGEVQK